MAVLTGADLEREKLTTHKKRRASLQAHINRRAELWAARMRAAEELQMAKTLIAKFERALGYESQFELAFLAASRAVTDADSNYPADLINNCQDPDLREELEAIGEHRRQAITVVQSGRDGMKKATEGLSLLVQSISQQRGAPARLNAGDALPWSTSLIGRVVGAFTGAETTWAICGVDVAFHPSVRPENVAHYADQWRDAQRSLRLAKITLDDAESRLQEAEQKFADVKTRMISSPV